MLSFRVKNIIIINSDLILSKNKILRLVYAKLNFIFIIKTNFCINLNSDKLSLNLLKIYYIQLSYMDKEMNFRKIFAAGYVLF